jgi:riboflavin kinase / FMN adenylyltransferase
VTGSDEDAETTIETHILDFQDNLYGRKLAIEFLAHLRDEHRFPNLEALARQIGRDVQQTRRYYRYIEKTSTRP